MTQGADLAAYARASHRLLGLIRGEHPPAAPGSGRFDRAVARLERARSLLEYFGNPQRRFPAVHVTGTSGKGSVAVMIANILTAAGYRVGLRTSPYLQVSTEKLQVDSELIAARTLDHLSLQVFAAHQRISPDIALGYAEAWVALAFAWFAEQDVDLAIIEVGSGGRFDTTNVFDPIVGVITSVGLDHTVSLGPTLADIAWHKAGIIKPGSSAVVGDVPSEALFVIQGEADRVGASLLLAGSLPSDFRGAVAMSGAFQEINAGIAIAAIDALRNRGFVIPGEAVVTGLANARLPGRLERMPGAGRPVVWLDGAHNADKIAAVARESRLIATGARGPVVVLGLLKSKDAGAIAAGVSPLASAIIATEPTVFGRMPLDAHSLGAAVKAAGFRRALHVEPDWRRAFAFAEMLGRENGSSVVATGSMYLAGQLRARWYSDAEIVVQRTPWPVVAEAADQTLPERSVAL